MFLGFSGSKFFRVMRAAPSKKIRGVWSTLCSRLAIECNDIIKKLVSGPLKCRVAKVSDFIPANIQIFVPS